MAEGVEVGRSLPASQEAEESLLGVCLLSATAVETCRDLVTDADFYRPSNAHIWGAVCWLWDHGETVDPVTVSEFLKREGKLDTVGGSAQLVSLQAKAPATSNARDYAQIVIDLAGYRRMASFAHDLQEQAMAAAPAEGGPSGLADWAVDRLGHIEVGAGQVPDGFGTLAEFMARPPEEHKPWVLRGLLRRGWRCVIIGEEGKGKSVILRQIALCASQGAHPFTHKPNVDPVRTLVVDLENPDEAIDEQVNLFVRPLNRVLGRPFDPEQVGLLRQEQGCDLRSRRSRAELEAVLSSFRPDIVCAGPAYKMYALERGEKHEQAVHAMLRVWDRWRARYGFALILEHHAPMSSGARGNREIRPADTMMWLRWPEFGLSMVPVKNEVHSFDLRRFRGDRVSGQWPTKIWRGGDWPWECSWPTGTFGPQEEEMF